MLQKIKCSEVHIFGVNWFDCGRGFSFWEISSLLQIIQVHKNLFILHHRIRLTLISYQGDFVDSKKKGSFLGGAYTQMYCMVSYEWIYVQENCFNVATSFVWDKKVGLAQIGNRELFTLETTPTTADCYMRRQKRYIRASKYGVCKLYVMAHQTKRYYWKYHTNIRLESTFTSDSDNARAFAGQAVFYRWQKRQAPEVEGGKNICSKCISLSFKI